MNRNGTPPKWSPWRWVSTTASSRDRSHCTRFTAWRMLGPQSSRNDAPGASTRYALWNRPPAPNASPEPSTVTRMTRCASVSSARDPVAGPRTARAARRSLAPCRASSAMTTPIYATPRTLTRGVLRASSGLRGRFFAAVALPGARRLLAFRCLIAEAFLEFVERALHALETPREVVRLTSELVALLLHLPQAALEILHDLGATDHEIARIRVHQPQRGAGTDDEAEQQGEQESDDDHGSFPPSGRVSARSPAPPRARRR